ncbi:MAG: nucleotidyltransferase domain-containing protein [Deltaproteobacteria bacterium]|nr:nucleotidyltransferase domain-containing protein [Deltaproteobacteria bacterium]
MALKRNKKVILRTVRQYVEHLQKNQIPIWRIYLYGSVAKGTYHENSDIDLAVFWDKEDIDGFNEDVQLMKLTKKIDLRLEPHSFARSDFDETNPYIKEIITTGERII